ncbi:MAG: hypothetical protein Q8P44_09610, partial [Dehalococcoidia bacterium]|nr:hypothetical protein [Dehalococcoidia bacterium]
EVTPENPYQWFSIIYPTNKKGRQKIEALLLNKGTLNPPVTYAILDYILAPQAGKSTSICKTIVIEQRYRDKDHTKALSSYYAKSFRQVETECTRLHFFARRLPSDYLYTKSTRELERSYLGFCVLRPFTRRRIGRTVLKRLRYQPVLEFPTCQGIFEVNLAGHKLSVEGSAFIEQDTMVAACASSAIWVSTTIMGTRFGLQQRSTSEITQLATQYLIGNRPMPSEGLVAEQMLHCLRAMDYDPLLIGVYSQKQAKHDIYSYIESEIPPILLCNFVAGEGHAIVGVGHGYDLPISSPFKTKVSWPGEHSIKFARSSEWVPSILVNDDQRGPYRKLTFIDSQTLATRIKALNSNVTMADLEEWKCPITIDINMPFSNYSGGEEIANIWGIIIPLPQNVLLTADQAESKSARVIRWWHLRNEVPLSEDLVLRTYLVLSNEYKERAKSSGMDPFVKALIAGKPMPRWIWVTEISSVNSYNSSNPEDWLINGQVIIDATSNAFTPDFLLFHHIVDSQAVLITMRPEHKDAEQAFSQYWVSSKDSKYAGWIR